MSEPLMATITCPECQHQAVEEIPTAWCQYFYICKGCGTRLKPKEQHCCVFCSWAGKPCPFCNQ
jgi:hypothetical protein